MRFLVTMRFFFYFTATAVNYLDVRTNNIKSHKTIYIVKKISLTSSSLGPWWNAVCFVFLAVFFSNAKLLFLIRKVIVFKTNILYGGFLIVIL